MANGGTSRPLRVAEIDHVVVRCADLARTLDFYTRVLGLREERRIDAIGLVQLRAGRSLVDLVPADAPPAFAERNVDHFCLAVELTDMETLVRYLAAEQVTMLGEPTERYGAYGHGPSLYVNDPEGNVVELKQLPRA
jgi:catechol 2,3-dioxygenase-like lactoylglutathione lyase family enzyme